MDSRPDFPLPLANGGDAPEDPWALPQQEPTTLIALWPGDSPPTHVEIIAALAQHLGGKLRQIDELEGNDVLWNGVFKSPALSSPIIIWAEGARPLGPDELDAPKLAACKWIVGTETMLSPQEPFDEYLVLLRALAAGLSSPAILDPITMRWSLEQELTDLTSNPPADPPSEVLWTIHAISDGENDPSRGEHWLHTHGLWRCGRPELEMLEVPAEHSNAAANLINEIAELALEMGLPPPGDSVTIGPDLSVAFQPWQAIAPQVDPKNAGGMNDREGEDNPHASVRAVICGPKPKGVFRKLWVWPRETVEKFVGENAVVFRTQRSTEKRAALAQVRWGELATAFASMRELTTANVGANRPTTLLKAGIPCDDGDPEHREHLWFEVQRFEGDKARAELLNSPLNIPSLHAGDVVDVHRDTVSDWAVHTAHGRFGPSDIPAMWRSIGRLKEASA